MKKKKRKGTGTSKEKYTFSENTPLFIIDLNKLQPGDIILTRDKTLRSISVRAATLGSYSHAMICLSPSSIIDATIDGKVYTKNTQRQIFKSVNDCIVLRLKSALSGSDIEKIENFLRLKVATPYSVKEAVRTPAEKNKSTEAKEQGQFCSRLVAQAYDHIGIRLAKNPDYCVPSDLSKSELLTKVENILLVANETNIKIANKKDLVEENRKETYAWLDRVTTLGKAENYNIDTINDVAKFLRAHPKYDRKVCEYIESTRYQTQYLDDIEANPERYFYNKDSSLDVEAELSNIKTIFEHQKKNYTATRKNYNLDKSKFNKLHKKLYTNLLKHLLRRLRVLVEYVDNSTNQDSGDLTLEINSMIYLITNTLK